MKWKEEKKHLIVYSNRVQVWCKLFIVSVVDTCSKKKSVLFGKCGFMLIFLLFSLKKSNNEKKVI